jgi:type II secretory pathway component PulM
MTQTKTVGLVLVLVWLAIAVPRADVAPDERAILQRLDVARALATMKALSEDVVKNRSGAGVGTAVAWRADKNALAHCIEQR